MRCLPWPRPPLPTRTIHPSAVSLPTPTLIRAGAGTPGPAFTADSVRDFAWAAAGHFIWDAVAANQGKTLVMSFYPPAADSIWNRASEYGKLAIEWYSKQWWPYPYPVATNINDTEGGIGIR